MDLTQPFLFNPSRRLNKLLLIFDCAAEFESHLCVWVGGVQFDANTELGDLCNPL